MSELLSVPRGIGGSWTIVAAGGPFSGSETLAAKVWAGGGQATAVTPTVVWLSSAAGTITLSVTATATATLEPARYRVRVQRADASADLYEGFLEVTDSPGMVAALPAYGSFGDLLDRAPWLEKLQKPTDLAGFARQRYLARKWFEDLLHRHYRGSSSVSADFAFVPGISFGGRFGAGMLWRDGRRSKDLQDWLDADRLDVTEQVKDAVACYAIALLCERQVTPGKEDSGYTQAACRWFARAEAAASEITAEIDSNGDGTNDVVIRLGSSDTLEG